MITQYGANNEKIIYTLNDTIQEYDKNMYVINIPALVCSNKKQAEKIQNYINSIIPKLVNKTLFEDEQKQMRNKKCTGTGYDMDYCREEKLGCEGCIYYKEAIE